jgi:hypothetical protein
MSNGALQGVFEQEADTLILLKLFPRSGEDFLAARGPNVLIRHDSPYNQ